MISEQIRLSWIVCCVVKDQVAGVGYISNQCWANSQLKEVHDFCEFPAWPMDCNSVTDLLREQDWNVREHELHCWNIERAKLGVWERKQVLLWKCSFDNGRKNVSCEQRRTKSLGIVCYIFLPFLERKKYFIIIGL